MTNPTKSRPNLNLTLLGIALAVGLSLSAVPSYAGATEVDPYCEVDCVAPFPDPAPEPTVEPTPDPEPTVTPTPDPTPEPTEPPVEEPTCDDGEELSNGYCVPIDVPLVCEAPAVNVNGECVVELTGEPVVIDTPSVTPVSDTSHLATTGVNEDVAIGLAVFGGGLLIVGALMFWLVRPSRTGVRRTSK
jgi:hypothetical protein